MEVPLIPLDNNKTVAPGTESSGSTFSCKKCSLTFSKRYNLNRHRLRQHGECTGSNGKIMCQFCQKPFQTKNVADQHLSAEHNLAIVTTSATFHSEAEFCSWKEEVEKRDCCYFISDRSGRTLADGTITKSYSCHRNGSYQPLACNRKRKLKMKGSVKMGSYCPARIRCVNTTIEDAVEISVQYVSTHVGHELDPKALRLPWSERCFLARQLQKGVPKDRVLQNIESNFNASKRMFLTTRKDLINLSSALIVKSSDPCEKSFNKNTDSILDVPDIIEDDSVSVGNDHAPDQNVSDETEVFSVGIDQVVVENDLGPIDKGSVPVGKELLLVEVIVPSLRKDNIQSETAEQLLQSIPEICQRFCDIGWVTATGGGISIRQGNEIFIAPSVADLPEFPPSKSHAGIQNCKKTTAKECQCTALFVDAFTKRGAGAVIHTHSKAAVLVTMICPGKEFAITHQEMIKGICRGTTGVNYRFDDELVVPVVENAETNKDLKVSMSQVLELYPDTHAILVRRHGAYIWGETWEKAKTMCECYDYLFDIAVKMKIMGLDPRVPNQAEPSSRVLQGLSNSPQVLEEVLQFAMGRDKHYTGSVAGGISVTDMYKSNFV